MSTFRKVQFSSFRTLGTSDFSESAQFHSFAFSENDQEKVAPNFCRYLTAPHLMQGVFLARVLRFGLGHGVLSLYTAFRDYARRFEPMHGVLWPMHNVLGLCTAFCIYARRFEPVHGVLSLCIAF